MNTVQDIQTLQTEFKNCQKLLTALGDESRQYLLSTMMSNQCSGNRVLNIAKDTNLSRPAVSRHLQILK